MKKTANQTFNKRRKITAAQPEVQVGQIWIFRYSDSFGKYIKQRTFMGLIIGFGEAHPVIKSWRVWDLTTNTELNAADQWFDTLEMFADAE